MKRMRLLFLRLILLLTIGLLLDSGKYILFSEENIHFLFTKDLCHDREATVHENITSQADNEKWAPTTDILVNFYSESSKVFNYISESSPEEISKSIWQPPKAS